MGYVRSHKLVTGALIFPSDDAFCVLAWALSLVLAVVSYIFSRVGYTGYHSKDVPDPSIDDQVYSFQLNMAAQLLYNPIICLVKASVLLFLMRLGDQRRVIRYSLIILFIFNIGHMIAVFFGVLIQCLPIHMYWDHPKTDQIIDDKIVNPNYTCFNIEAFFMATASIGILTDILILSVPIAMVWPLELNLRKKLAVGFVLSLSWMVVVVALLRLKSLYDLFHTVDPGSKFGFSILTTLVEVNVAIVLSCAPAINSIITRFASKLFTTTADTAKDPYEREMPTRRPVRDDLHSLSSSRIRSRLYLAIEEDANRKLGIMNSDSLGAWRADAIRAMADDDKNVPAMWIGRSPVLR